MRRLLVLMWCVSSAASDLTQLRQLADINRMFELRQALQQPGWNDTETFFYRAVIAARFGHEIAAIDDVRKFLAAHPDPEMERKAYEELASSLARIGRYGEAARAWAEALRRTPHKDDLRADDENTRALYEALRDVPPQTIHFGDDTPIQARHNRLGSWDVPVEVNGHEGEWIFDTGANLSTLSESEAKRLGLSIRETATYVRGSTGKKNPLRLAVAGDLRFGTAHLSNVVFLVLADEALYVGPLKYRISGILGLPVIRALGRVRMSAKGLLRIETNTPVAKVESNLFFDELSSIVQTRHADHRLQMFLDTGANTTFLYPSFRDALGKEEIARLKRKREKTAGAGGMVKRTTDVLPTLRLDFSGRAIDLTKVSLLPTQPEGTAGYRDGVLGMDALAGGFTLDFRTMQLLLE
jgi:predicted aspartyl protease